MDYVSRRSWVGATEFVPLLAHQFFFKRFFGIYEKALLKDDHTLGYNYKLEVDLRELVKFFTRLRLFMFPPFSAVSCTTFLLSAQDFFLAMNFLETEFPLSYLILVYIYLLHIKSKQTTKVGCPLS
jgi:hypothetical protein